MKHTIDQLPIVLTQGVSFEFEKELTELLAKVASEYDNQPDVRTNGDNDKNFFSMFYKDKKLFVARNELNGLTIMFPDEY